MKKKIVRIAAAALIAALVFCALTLVLREINDSLSIMADSLVKEYAVRIINDGVKKSLSDSELLALEKDEKGKISYIKINTDEVNRITTDAVQYINDTMAGLGYEKIEIPAGDLLSSPYTMGRGPNLTVRAMLNGGIEYDVSSSVSDAGINQTLFSMKINFTAPMTYYSGFMREDIDIQATVPIYEVIIVGDVPETYAKLSDAADFINLIP